MKRGAEMMAAARWLRDELDTPNANDVAYEFALNFIGMSREKAYRFAYQNGEED